MRKITKHPILEIPVGQETEFVFEGKKVIEQKGITIAAALNQAE